MWKASGSSSPPLVTSWQTKGPPQVFSDLDRYESRTYSQDGEDGLLARIFQLLGPANRFFVEFGTGKSGRQRNTRLLEKRGWTGLLMDAAAAENHPRIRKERITAENINDLLLKYGVPEEFDLLSIDIDGNDYWVWRAIEARYRPRVVVIEYNASVPPTASKAIRYDPNYLFRRTDYFGGSLLALDRLGRDKGYALIYCESHGVNAFFVRSDLAPQTSKSVKETYRPPRRRLFRNLPFWPADPEMRMIDVG